MEEDASGVDGTHATTTTRPEFYDLGNGYCTWPSRWMISRRCVASGGQGGGCAAPKTMTVEGHDYRIAFIVDPDVYRIE